MKQQILDALIPLLATALTTALTAALTMLFRYLASLAKGTKLEGIANKFAHLASTVVADLDATLKVELKKRLEDGVLTKVEVAELRAIALDRMKTLAGQQGLNELSSVMGLAGEQLNQYLLGLIERQVAQHNVTVAQKDALAAQASQAVFATSPVKPPSPQ